jgi:hypothetical protein
MSMIEDKQTITEVYFTLINESNLELYRVIKEHLEKAKPIFPLIGYIIDRLGCVTELTLSERVWDAEIILRSALETFIKFIFITSNDKNEQKKRLNEFWEELSEINSLKQSEQAKKNLNHLGDVEVHNLAFSPIVLTEKREEELRSKWSKKERQKLEQKWSFSEMISSLSKNHRGKPAAIFQTLAHTYRIGSHLSHGDETGISIINERNSRTPEEQQKVHFAHYLRLLSDTLNICSVTGIETMHYLGVDHSFFILNLQKVSCVGILVDKYHLAVFEDKDYDKFRK